MSEVNTKKAERRPLRLDSVPALRAEIDRVVEAERAGRLRRTGNWTVGQAFGHVAAFIDYGYIGFPADLPMPPGPVRFLLKFMKNKFLNKGLPVGIRIPKVPGGTLAIEPLPTDEGTRRLKAALDRLEAQPPSHPSPAFGVMSREDWTKLQLRHAELHLSFLHP